MPRKSQWSSDFQQKKTFSSENMTCERPPPLSSELATDEPVWTKFWLWLELFSVRNSSKQFRLFAPRSSAARVVLRTARFRTAKVELPKQTACECVPNAQILRPNPPTCRLYTLKERIPSTLNPLSYDPGVSGPDMIMMGECRVISISQPRPPSDLITQSV